MHAGSSPERVGPAHVPYQLHVFRERRLVVLAYAVSSSKSNINLNPQRCQRMTVSGFTMTRTLSQSVQILRNSTQNSRSNMASVYPGYDAAASIGQVMLMTVYGLVDGAVAGLIFGWLYNRLAAGAPAENR